MSNTTAYTYDKLGRLASLVFPNGSLVSYSYDELGNRTTVSEVANVTPPPPPTPSALPKRSQSDFKNDPMVVLLSSGELVGWGDNTTGVLANGVEISTGTDALVQRVLFNPNTTVPPLAATIVDWAFTNANLYVVYNNGWVYSAGSNSYGQLGQGDTTDRPYLTRIESFVTAGLTITGVWAQGGYTTTNGGGCVFFQASTYAMYGCGLNTAGELGNATTPTTNISTPALCTLSDTSSHVIDVEMATASTFISVYFLMADGGVQVAGYNVQGQLGVNTVVNVTGGFIAAMQTGSVVISNAKSISANAGSTAAGNALIIDANNNVWTTGYNAHSELGLGNTTNQKLFAQVTALSGITPGSAKLVGGAYGFGYALNSAGTLYTWGYNAQNNLFQNSTTVVSTPTAASYLPSGAISKIFAGRGQQGLTTTQQLILLMGSGKLVYAGADIGQEPINNTGSAPTAYSLIAMPLSLVNGSDSIMDLFVHGTGITQRWFILTTSGRLYGCGQNNDAICNGSVASASLALNAQWQEIVFSS